MRVELQLLAPQSPPYQSLVTMSYSATFNEETHQSKLEINLKIYLNVIFYIVSLHW